MMVVLLRMSQLGTYQGSQVLIQEYKLMFGLDADYGTQFVSYIREVFKGNLGYSINYFPSTVSTLIMAALPWTIFLLAASTIISWMLGTLSGTVLGWKGKESRVGTFIFAPIAWVMRTIPYYMLALIMVYVFAFTLGWFPISGAYQVGTATGYNFSLSGILQLLWYVSLPALTIIISSLGGWYLSMRAMIMTVKGEDFMLMAEAKGLSERTILWSYGFRNALIPQVTSLALNLGNIMSGAMLTEIIFNYPGLGFRLYFAIISADYPVIQGITLLITISVCVATFIIDLIYPLLDPRIKLTSS
jgi:peptide/nickel transport system permease protein